MVDFEGYISRLRELGWEPDRDLADHVKAKGYSLSWVEKMGPKLKLFHEVQSRGGNYKKVCNPFKCITEIKNGFIDSPIACLD